MPFETPSPALARVRKGENERKTGDLSVRSPFRRSTEHTLETFRKLGELEETMPDLDRPATVAEEFGNRQMLHLMRLRLLGTFLRLLDAEIAAGNLTPAVREQRRLLGERFETWYGQAEADSPCLPIELRKLVAVQLGAALTADLVLATADRIEPALSRSGRQMR